MVRKIPHVIGTTPAAIDRAEAALQRPLPPSFRAWLLRHNGQDLGRVHIYPVFDERDPRKTWDSIVRNYAERWAAWLDNFEACAADFSALLPFADWGTGDFYCFDGARGQNAGEHAVVLWSHETGATQLRGASFTEFQRRLLGGEFDTD